MSSRGRIVLQIIISSLPHFKISEEDKAVTVEPAQPPEGQQRGFKSGKSSLWQ